MSYSFYMKLTCVIEPLSVWSKSRITEIIYVFQNHSDAIPEVGFNKDNYYFLK